MLAHLKIEHSFYSLPKRGSVVGDDHQLALSIPQCLQCLLVAKNILNRGNGVRFKTSLEQKIYATFPDFMTKASLELMDSLLFFTFFCAPIAVSGNQNLLKTIFHTGNINITIIQQDPNYQLPLLLL